MSDRDTSPGCDLIHVATGPIQTVAWAEVLLAESGVHVLTFTDAYRALVRLGDSDSARPGAVVVCMDFIAPSEYEFFEIVGREHPGVGVYVYGDRRCDHKVSRALELGARGRLSVEVLRELVPAHPAADNGESGAALQVDDDRGQSTAVPAVPAVRVPWLDYTDGTRRIPPAPADSQADDPLLTPSPSAAEDPQPLLSEAELQALIGPDEGSSPPLTGSDRSVTP